ncbi:dynamin family protein [Jiangella asiatica]|uniref:dynamin family protein n=1 Tax=Jiangella asiatica TaxID=2530372 RepID=UPI00193DFB12|nr:dynamin family protein [Jiangella asiatica]
MQYPLAVAGADDARRVRREVLAQLDDYILPRLDHLDAPMLAVVGGSTGAGKSTLVNSLVRRRVSDTGVLRPTTRSPILVHHPEDAEWFDELRILPDLPRVEIHDQAGGALRLVADDGLPSGVAILDAPDVDSVVTENRTLAAQLLAAADLWLFVTTAARYSDAVPWDFLRAAAARQAAVAVVLDRVAPEAVSEIRSHLAAMLAEHGLGDAPLFVVEETMPDDDGLLPAPAVAAVRAWLDGLAADEASRTQIVRRTLDGAVDGVLLQVPSLAEAADLQVETVTGLQADVAHVYEAACRRIDEAAADGSMLRGEVLARWQDFVGTGDFLRSLEARVGRVRDKVTAFLRGRPQPAAAVEEAIEHGLAAVVVEEANRAAEQADSRWRETSAGRALLGDDDLTRAADDVPARAAEMVRSWQDAVLELVRTEGASRRFNARLLSFGVNGLGLALMIVVFASTAGLTGAEVGVAGGTAAVGQKLLEAFFGDEAVRRLASKARRDLSARVSALLESESARFTDRLGGLPVDVAAGTVLRAARSDAEQARERAA